eukprot:314002-Rhodomonas_salina.1
MATPATAPLPSTHVTSTHVIFQYPRTDFSPRTSTYRDVPTLVPALPPTLAPTARASAKKAAARSPEVCHVVDAHDASLG